ncbi:carbohydrate binding domain-containing protein [Parabacteroides sp. OttesenSCG-928-O15]|nr:carbohydrate binding domain-containing protein [Parabacteroides sp. OttesenSCG-928-O15]
MRFKKTFSKLLLIIGIISYSSGQFTIRANEPDSAYIFAYTSEAMKGSGGLFFAWSIDQEAWHQIGPEHSFVKSDYSAWGSEKRMYAPVLFQAPDGSWQCVWELNDRDAAFAHASSPDLVYWGRQSYPIMMPEGNCLKPDITYDAGKREYIVTWESNKPEKVGIYSSTTKDFKTYSPTQKINSRKSNKTELVIAGAKETGMLYRVPWSVVDNLQKAQKLAAYAGILRNERVAMDPAVIRNPVTATISLQPEKRKPISDLLMGIFFEDINYAADGGLYAELVQNRDFEYRPEENRRDPEWNSKKAWSVKAGEIDFNIETSSPIHENNSHYAALTIKQAGAALVNEGFDGIVLKAGDKYDFSLFARSPEAKRGKLLVRLTGKNGEVYAEASTSAVPKEWKKLHVVITAKQTVDDARLEVIPQQTGRVDLDMISLFPQKTFKGRKNGLRPDLAQVIADMKPRFVRFPGGCVAHGNGIENIYRWENTIGNLEERKPQYNIWNYHQSAGLGYFEYFQFCEDLGAEPLPVVAAGVPCQNSAKHNHPIGGQQGGIPMCEMDDYVQSILNLIEYANGDAKSEWGRKRAAAGHPKPFNLKYLGVGNEDLITDVFEERFMMINDAIKAKYPEIVVIGTVGPFFEGTDYVEGWELATKIDLPMVDEHYYQSPGWYINNQDYYDRYDRSKPQVYLGEYAAHVPSRYNNLEAALCEALHLINVERNADIVAMTSYAPLLGKEGHTQWNPDLIYFTNTEIKPSVGYFVQKLFGVHSGNEYLTSQVKMSNNRQDIRKRVATSFVIDQATNDLIIKIVNLLPVAVPSTIDLSGMEPAGNQAAVYVLQGDPEDRDARPKESTIEVSEQFDYQLPAYSFSVIRLKLK